MADNITGNPGVGGDVIAADDISSVKYQRIKIVHGADGVSDGDVATGNPLPVVQTGTPGLPTGASTAANQTTVIGHLDGVEGLLGTIDADTGNIDTNAGTTADASATAGGTGTISAKLRRLTADTDAIKTAVTGTLTVTGGGGGTEYTEDAAAAANPVGTTLQLIREDARAGGLTSTDGDNVALRGNNKGEAYVKATDSDALLTTIDAKLGGTLTVTGGGGGVEYTEGDTDATITGSVAMMEGAANTILPIQGTVADGLLVNLGSNNDVTVSGVSTAANQSTIIGHVDGIEGLLTTIDGDTGTLAGAVSGSEMQVDIVSAPTLTVNAHAVTNAGTFATQVDGAALTALQKIDDPVVVDDAAFTPATSSVMMAGFEADDSSTDSVDEGDGGAARMTLDRKQIVTPQPHTTGGLTIFRSIDLDETEEEVKSTAGQVYGMWVTNTATSTRWLKFYNATAASVTVGTTTPVITVGIPGNSSDDISGLTGNGSMGIEFNTAITVAATTGVADNDTGAPGANEVIINLFYK